MFKTLYVAFDILFFELPVGVFDTQEELARFLGINKTCVKYHLKSKTPLKVFKNICLERVKVDFDETEIKILKNNIEKP